MLGSGKTPFKKRISWELPAHHQVQPIQVRETADIPRIITEAVHIATTGRPGPVVIDLPKDVSALETDFIYEPSVKLPSYQPTIEPNELQIKKILKQLSKAKKPVLLAGGRVSYAGAAKELIALAERYQIPVVTSLLAKERLQPVILFS